MNDDVKCPECQHPFAGATHTGRDGKGCDVIIERTLETMPVQVVKERCGCTLNPRYHGLDAAGRPRHGR